MKKFLLSLAVCATIAASAQANYEVTVVSPTNGQAIVANQTWTFEATVKNTGTIAHAGFPTDTMAIFPLFNGSTIGVGWYIADAIPVGSTVTFTETLGIQDGASGPIEICGYVEAYGASYGTSVFSTTGTACSTVQYDNLMAIGEMKLAQTFDNSYYNNGTYFVQVDSKVNLSNPSIEVVDINGRVILQEALNTNGTEIRTELSLEGFAQGIYIVRLRTAEGLISINKIMM